MRAECPDSELPRARLCWAPAHRPVPPPTPTLPCPLPCPCPPRGSSDSLLGGGRGVPTGLRGQVSPSWPARGARGRRGRTWSPREPGAPPGSGLRVSKEPEPCPCPPAPVGSRSRFHRPPRHLVKSQKGDPLPWLHTRLLAAWVPGSVYSIHRVPLLTASSPSGSCSRGSGWSFPPAPPCPSRSPPAPPCPSRITAAPSEPQRLSRVRPPAECRVGVPRAA